MKGKGILIFLIILIVIIAVAVWLSKGKKKEVEPQTITVVPESTLKEKIDMPIEKLDKAFEEAEKFARGERSTYVEVDYPKEMGNKEAKVRVDAFFPPGGEGVSVSTEALKKLVEENKNKLYVRISLLVGPVAQEVGLDCAAVFINGKNYITADGEEIVLIRKTTHNTELLRKAIQQAIAQAYGE